MAVSHTSVLVSVLCYLQCTNGCVSFSEWGNMAAGHSISAERSGHKGFING